MGTLNQERDVPRHTPPIIEALSDLEGQVKVLYEDIVNLECRLNPCLSPCTPAEAGKRIEAAPAPKSEIAGRLEALGGELVTLTAQLRVLRDRIEL